MQPTPEVNIRDEQTAEMEQTEKFELFSPLLGY